MNNREAAFKKERGWGWREEVTAAVVSPTLCNIQLQFQIIMNSAFCIFRMTTVFFGLLSVGKASCDRVALPDVRCLLGNVRTNVNVCDCTRGVCGHT